MASNTTSQDPATRDESMSMEMFGLCTANARHDWFRRRSDDLALHRELQTRSWGLVERWPYSGRAIGLRFSILSKIDPLASRAELPSDDYVSEADYKPIWDDLLSTLHRAKEDMDRLPTLELELPTKAALHAARARNAIAVATDKVRLLRDSLSQDAAARQLGVPKQKLNQWSQQGQVLALRSRGTESHRYPAWQFTDRGELVEGLRQVLETAQEVDMGAEVLHFFMVEPNDRLGGRAPADLLARGQVAEVVRTIRTSGLGPF